MENSEGARIFPGRGGGGGMGGKGGESKTPALCFFGKNGMII